MTSIISLRSMLEANKLIGPNFLDWYHNVRIVLKKEIRLYFHYNPIPVVTDKVVNEEVRNTCQHRIDDDEQATYVMLAIMTLELQRYNENIDVYTMIINLKKLFDVVFILWL